MNNRRVGRAASIRRRQCRHPRYTLCPLPPRPVAAFCHFSLFLRFSPFLSSPPRAGPFPFHSSRLPRAHFSSFFSFIFESGIRGRNRKRHGKVSNRYSTAVSPRRTSVERYTAWRTGPTHAAFTVVLSNPMQLAHSIFRRSPHTSNDRFVEPLRRIDSTVVALNQLAAA